MWTVCFQPVPFACMKRIWVSDDVVVGQREQEESAAKDRSEVKPTMEHKNKSSMFNDCQST